MILLFLLTKSSMAQVSDGSIAPDFTFTDINGISRNLYSYLDQGKYVALEVSATWCLPCWNYHNSGTMDSLYDLHDDPGDHTWKVLFVEGDAGTNLADIQGTGTNTQGNWTTGTQYPIMNPSSGASLNDFLAGYNIVFWPTLFVICPDRKIYQDTLNGAVKPALGVWKYIATNSCSPVRVNEITGSKLAIYPNPAKDNVTLSFRIGNTSGIMLTVNNLLGEVIDTQAYGTFSTGWQALQYDISHLAAGMYIITLSDADGMYVREKIIVQ
ncbi:MAG: hypothetical protein K0Q79_3546 [Flavipsychrobacter sp.]|nr:hypothetical protein [Flavipsychrobacter sp.]